MIVTSHNHTTKSENFYLRCHIPRRKRCRSDALKTFFSFFFPRFFILSFRYPLYIPYIVTVNAVCAVPLVYDVCNEFQRDNSGKRGRRCKLISNRPRRTRERCTCRFIRTVQGEIRTCSHGRTHVYTPVYLSICLLICLFIHSAIYLYV